MNKQVLFSYLRHLAVTAVGVVIAIVQTQHVGLAHLTKADVLTIANAVWLAILPQLRFGAEPLINAYLKKQYPALGIVLSDLESFNSQAEADNAKVAPAKI
jgi:hypothetical protein